MPKANEYLQGKYKAIREDFKALSDEGYKSHVIYKKLAKKYFYAPITIDDIVWGNGIYSDKPKEKKADKKQMTIFDVIDNPDDNVEPKKNKTKSR